MPVREFELFHGAVLTKLARSDRPLTLRMIETRPADAWSTYRVNDEVNVLVKHSLVSRTLKRENAKAWQFNFSPDQIRQLQAESTWAALICGGKTLKDSDMEVCLLDPEQVAEVLDITTEAQQSISVKCIEGKSLRVLSPRRQNDIVVPRNRLDTWAVSK